jgi:crotonobetainyl-CoA:carnitine CoA-transferase CaiB-like acyl-CoA transferase
MADSLLGGFRALDLTDDKGLVCGQILAAMGVEVIKVERPAGDPARKLPPVFRSAAGVENSLYWQSFNNNKKGITLDIQKSQGLDLFRRLVKQSDFVLESFDPGYLEDLGSGYEALNKVNRRIIFTSITHFGQKVTHSQYKGSELVDSAMSGLMDNTGDMDRAPLKEALDSVYFHANAAAALGTVIAHYSRETDGEGQQVDVSIQEVGASRTGLCQLPWVWEKRLIHRSGPMTHLGARPFRAIWPCKDGYVLWFYQGGKIGAPANRALTKWINEEGLENPLNQVTNWEEHDMADVSGETHAAYQATIYNFFKRYTKQEIVEEGLKRGINAVAECTPSEVLENRQLKARNFWVELGQGGAEETLAYPGRYFLCNQTENFLERPAPEVGQHNTEIYGKILGLSDKALAGLRQAGVI